MAALSSSSRPGRTSDVDIHDGVRHVSSRALYVLIHNMSPGPVAVPAPRSSVRLSLCPHWRQSAPSGVGRRVVEHADEVADQDDRQHRPACAAVVVTVSRSSGSFGGGLLTPAISGASRRQARRGVSRVRRREAISRLAPRQGTRRGAPGWQQLQLVLGLAARPRRCRRSRSARRRPG